MPGSKASRRRRERSPWWADRPRGRPHRRLSPRTRGRCSRTRICGRQDRYCARAGSARHTEATSLASREAPHLAAEGGSSSDSFRGATRLSTLRDEDSPPPQTFGGGRHRPARGVVGLPPPTLASLLRQPYSGLLDLRPLPLPPPRSPYGGDRSTPMSSRTGRRRSSRLWANS
jgi:hypothetical protein